MTEWAVELKDVKRNSLMMSLHVSHGDKGRFVECRS